MTILTMVILRFFTLPIVSKGMTVRVIARANFKVGIANGEKSKLHFHSSPDGATIVPLDNDHVYVGNSEVTAGEKIR